MPGPGMQNRSKTTRTLNEQQHQPLPFLYLGRPCPLHDVSPEPARQRRPHVWVDEGDGLPAHLPPLVQGAVQEAVVERGGVAVAHRRPEVAHREPAAVHPTDKVLNIFIFFKKIQVFAYFDDFLEGPDFFL